MSEAFFIDFKSPRPWILLAGFMIIVVGVGAIIGTQSVPGAWYEALVKPPFNPPNWIFGPVWFALYIMIAVAGWRIFLVDASSTAMKVWYGQMLLNWSWSPIWFVAQLIWPAFAIIVALWLLIVFFTVVAAKIDKSAAWLFVPYLAWVSFAALLNLSIAILN